MSKPDSTSKDKLLLLFVLLTTSVLLWVVFGFAAPALAKLFELEGTTLGQFGDVFGAANALFSSLAFAGLIYTALLQRAELALQREELSETRRVLSAQEAQLGEQNKTFRKQTLENRYFQLLQLQHGIVNAIDIRKGGDVTNQGRDCFRVFYREIARNYHTTKDNTNSPTFGFSSDAFRELKIDSHLRSAHYAALQKERNQQVPTEVVAAYLIMFAERQGDLGHYFRNLYHIIRYIHRSELPDDEKQFFIRLVRAQLSMYELLLLFYNCLGPHGYELFKPLVEQYALLENLDTNYLLDTAHRGLYSPNSYGPGPV